MSKFIKSFIGRCINCDKKKTLYNTDSGKTGSCRECWEYRESYAKSELIGQD